MTGIHARDIPGLSRVGRTAFATLVCLSLALWSVLPSAKHAPAVFEIIQDHLETVAEHGHSHGFEHDLHQVLHGHGHDTADHDHSQAVLLARAPISVQEAGRDGWRFRSSDPGAYRIFRIDRPPRV